MILIPFFSYTHLFLNTYQIIFKKLFYVAILSSHSTRTIRAYRNAQSWAKSFLIMPRLTRIFFTSSPSTTKILAEMVKQHPSKVMWPSPRKRSYVLGPQFRKHTVWTFICTNWFLNELWGCDFSNAVRLEYIRINKNVCCWEIWNAVRYRWVLISGQKRLKNWFAV